MCHEVKKVEDTRKRMARKLQKSSCIFAHPYPFLVLLLPPLLSGSQSPVTYLQRESPQKGLILSLMALHWWLSDPKERETRVEGKHGGRRHLGRELSLAPLKSASSYPHIQTCTKSPGLEELRGQLERHDLLETRGIRPGCLVL